MSHDTSFLGSAHSHFPSGVLLDPWNSTRKWGPGALRPWGPQIPLFLLLSSSPTQSKSFQGGDGAGRKQKSSIRPSLQFRIRQAGTQARRPCRVSLLSIHLSHVSVEATSAELTPNCWWRVGATPGEGRQEGVSGGASGDRSRTAGAPPASVPVARPARAEQVKELEGHPELLSYT